MSQVPSNTEPLRGLLSLTSRKYNFSDRYMQCLDSSVIHLNGFFLNGQRAGLRISLSVHFPKGSSLELNFYRISRTRAALALSTLGRSTYATLSLAKVFVSSVVIRYLHLTDWEAGKPTVKKLLSAGCLLTGSHGMRWMSRAIHVVCEGESMAVPPSHTAFLCQSAIGTDNSVIFYTVPWFTLGNLPCDKPISPFLGNTSFFTLGPYREFLLGISPELVDWKGATEWFKVDHLLMFPSSSLHQTK